MVRVFLTLSLVSVIGGAPVATAVCQVSCAIHDAGMASTGSQRHSCHEDPSSAGVAINGIVHDCGHPTEFQASVDHLLRIGTPSVASALFALVPPTADTVRRAAAEVEHRPRAPASGTIQLRV